jgi:hypothetical protein
MCSRASKAKQVRSPGVKSALENPLDQAGATENYLLLSVVYSPVEKSFSGEVSAEELFLSCSRQVGQISTGSEVQGV